MLGFWLKSDFSLKSQILISPEERAYKNKLLWPNWLKLAFETIGWVLCFVPFKLTKLYVVSWLHLLRFHKNTPLSSEERKFSLSMFSEREWMLLSLPNLNVCSNFAEWWASPVYLALGIVSPNPLFKSLADESNFFDWLCFTFHSLTSFLLAVSNEFWVGWSNQRICETISGICWLDSKSIYRSCAWNSIMYSKFV